MKVSERRAADSLNSRVSPQLAPPQLAELQEWHVSQHLGSGTTAHVWRLEHVTQQLSVVCKSPRSSQDAALLSQEAKLAEELRHENLVRPVNADDIGLRVASHESEVTLWEFLPGGTLEALVGAVDRLPLAQTVTVLLPMIQVAQYLQSMQVVHGDFSPRNILFDLTGRPVLIDLGSARGTAHANHLTGTPGFVAPEHWNADAIHGGLDVGSDVYSLAAIGWFCLTGDVPGPPQQRVPLITMRPDLDGDVVEMLEAGLAVDPGLRPSLDVLLSAVAVWADPEPVDLYASVGEEYELVLPTRQPEVSLPRRSRLFRGNSHRLPKQRTSRAPQHRPVVSRARLGMFFTCAVAIGIGAVALSGHLPSWWQGQDASQPGGIEQSQLDIQAVIDAVAQTRSAAWANTDPSLVSQYALDGSKLYDAEVTVLESLAASGTSLDGIRMRGVVQRTDRSEDVLVIDVEWRTDAYIQKNAAGDMIEEHPARFEGLVLTVQNTDAGWRLTAVASQ